MKIIELDKGQLTQEAIYAKWLSELEQTVQAGDIIVVNRHNQNPVTLLMSARSDGAWHAIKLGSDIGVWRPAISLHDAIYDYFNTSNYNHATISEFTVYKSNDQQLILGSSEKEEN